MLFLLFLMTCIFTSQSQSQIEIAAPGQYEWKVEGKNASISKFHVLNNKEKIVYLLWLNGKGYFTNYDYNNDEFEELIELDDDLSKFVISNSHGIVANYLVDSLIQILDYDGTVKKQIKRNDIVDIYLYDENEALAFKRNEDTSTELIRYDVEKDEIVETFPDYGGVMVQNFIEIDGNIFFVSNTKGETKVVIYNIAKNQIMNEVSNIDFKYNNYQLLDNEIITFALSSYKGYYFTEVVVWDRTTLDTIKTIRIDSLNGVFDASEYKDGIVKMIVKDLRLVRYDFNENEIVEIIDTVEYNNYIHLGDGKKYAYKFFNHQEFEIYNENMNSLYGTISLFKEDYHKSGINCVKILPNKILTGSDDKTIKEWDFTGQLLSTPIEDDLFVLDIDYSEKYDLIGVSYGHIGKGRIRIFNSNWELLFEKDYDNKVVNFKFYDEYNKFITSGREIPIEVFSIDEMELLNSINIPQSVNFNKTVNDFIMYENDKLAYTFKNGLILYDLEKNTKIKENVDFNLPISLDATSIVFDKKRNAFLIGTSNQYMFVLDTNLIYINDFRTTYTDINGVTVGEGVKELKNIKDDYYYFLFGRQISVFDVETQITYHNYYMLNPDGIKNYWIGYNDMDISDDLVVTVNSFAEIYSLVPYQVTSKVESKLVPKLIFPNPAKEQINIDLDYFDDLIMFNSNGLIVKHYRDYQNIIDIKELSSGTYFVKIKQNKKEIYGKFIKID